MVAKGCTLNYQVQHGCFTLSLAREQIMFRRSTGFSHRKGIDQKPFDLDCSDDLVRLLESMENKWRAIDRVARAIMLFDIGFALLHCKVFLEDWMTVAPNLIFQWNELLIVDCFNYLDNWVKMDSSMEVEVRVRIFKVQATNAEMKHWRRQPVIFEVERVRVLYRSGHSSVVCLRDMEFTSQMISAWFPTTELYVTWLGSDGVTAWAMWRFKFEEERIFRHLLVDLVSWLKYVLRQTHV